MTLARIKDRLRTGLWFVPLVLVSGFVVLATILPAVDDALTLPAVTTDPDTARQLLSTIATATVTFAGLVFSITIVALQLTSSQFSPRVLRQFLRDRPSQVALGVFVGSFVYDLLVLGRVTGDPDPFVPNLSVDVAIVAGVLAVATYLLFVNHIAQSIRVVRIIDNVASEARVTAAALRREAPGDPTPDRACDGMSTVDRVCRPGDGAVLQDMDVDALVVIAADHDVVLRIVPEIGAYVTGGSVVLEVLGTPGTRSTPEWSDVDEAFGFGPERTMTSDLAFGYRQLADIGAKALSPSLNDPTTALQCLDRLHDLLRTEAGRGRIARVHCDGDGTGRLVHAVIDWDELLHLALDEIRLYGCDSIQVVRRIRAMLVDLRTVDGVDHDAIDEQFGLLDRAIQRSFPDPVDRRHAGVADEQGIGDDGD